MKVKVSWSGGKDSTASVILNLAEGHEVTAVCYIPRFTEDIPLIERDHFEFLHRAGEEFEKRGAKVIFTEGMTYYDCVMKKRRDGKPYGFPIPVTGKCEFLKPKIAALRKVQVDSDWEDVGIAADEGKRLASLKEGYRSILAEKGYTEEDARILCRDQNLLSPHYGKGNRDGCALCPNAKSAERERWLKEFPEALPILLELQDYVLQFDYITKSGKVMKHWPLRKGGVFLERVNTLFGEQIVIH